MKKENINLNKIIKDEKDVSEFDEEFIRNACDINLHPMESF